MTKEQVYAVAGLVLMIPLFLANAWFLTDILNMTLPLFNIGFKMTFMLSVLLLLVKNTLGIYGGASIMTISNLVKNPDKKSEATFMSMTTGTVGYLITWIIIKIII